jgi:aromatic ring-opening dioxygenase LigB subunit
VVLSCPVDLTLAAECVVALHDAEVPVVGASFGANDPGAATAPMDWGVLIPLWYMGGRSEPPVPTVVVSPARDRPMSEHVRAGKALADAAAASSLRVALVASADHGHAHDAAGPYGLDTAAAEYDARVVELVAENRLAGLAELEPEFVDRAKADSWWQLSMLYGALGGGWHGELLSYEAPTYFGMLCAAYAPR